MRVKLGVTRGQLRSKRDNVILIHPGVLKQAEDAAVCLNPRCSKLRTGPRRKA